LILIVTDEDTVGWKFSPEQGLTKYITIQNQYALVDLLPKHCFLGIRSDGQLEKVNCVNGKIEELLNCDLEVPTDLHYLGGGSVLVASKIGRSVNVIDIRRREVLKELAFKETITYIDHYDQEELILQYFNNPCLYRFSLKDEKETELARLPVGILRFGGWLHSVSKQGNRQLKSKLRKYWFGVSEGKVIIIPHLHKDGKKKIRVRQTDRIAQVVKPSGRLLGCNLALVPYNFTKMIEELPVQPVFTKKIV
jgi:hypothetical protein